MTPPSIGSGNAAWICPFHCANTLTCPKHCSPPTGAPQAPAPKLERRLLDLAHRKSRKARALPHEGLWGAAVVCPSPGLTTPPLLCSTSRLLKPCAPLLDKRGRYFEACIRPPRVPALPLAFGWKGLISKFHPTRGLSAATPNQTRLEVHTTFGIRIPSFRRERHICIVLPMILRLRAHRGGSFLERTSAPAT